MLLEQLSMASGVSGNEKEVRDIIKEAVQDRVDEMHVDNLGNLITVKKGKKSGPKVMIAAHMDEVGLMITWVEKNGMLRFTTVGGIDRRVLQGKAVLVGPNRLPGVIGSKPIHRQDPAERSKPMAINQLFIDIGAKSKEDAEKKVKIGDYVIFATKFAEIGDGKYKGKALDDRVGCLVLMETLKNSYSMPVYGVFTTMEEIGTRGAAVSAHAIDPDLGIVLEGTVCADFMFDVPEGHATSSGAGPALSLMDASSIANKKMVQKLVELADKNKIPYQFRRATSGGNDAGRISLTRKGVPACSISVPCRYIHSPVSVVSKSDIDNAVKLLGLFLKSIEQGGLSL